MYLQPHTRSRLTAVLLLTTSTLIGATVGRQCHGQIVEKGAQLVQLEASVASIPPAVGKFRWQVTAEKPYRVSTNLVVFEASSPKARQIQGGAHDPTGQATFEVTLDVRVQSDGSVTLIRGSTTDGTKTALNLPLAASNARLVDQTSHFRPAALKVGEFRVLWEGVIHQDGKYFQRVQFVVGLVGNDDSSGRYQPDAQAALRSNSQLAITKEDIAAEWTVHSLQGGPVWRIDMQPDGSYQRRQGAPAGRLGFVVPDIGGSAPATPGFADSGTWEVNADQLVLRATGEDAGHVWTVVDFSINDQRLGDQQLRLQNEAGNELGLIREAGDMRTGLRDREQIGTALGKPVYRDQIRGSFPLRSELHRLFPGPAMQRYREAHREQITPTQDEVTATAAYLTRTMRERMQGDYGDTLRKNVADITSQLANTELPEDQRALLARRRESLDKMLNPSAEQHVFTARWMLSSWKFQRFLYSAYGGGRILWQQAGVEAFDAMHRWYQKHEMAGDFTITDPALRADFYAYWTNEKMHGAFLTGDEERIRTSFLQPPWFRDGTDG